jgi:glycosyltransferase involved in cell wall biosynthesis
MIVSIVTPVLNGGSYFRECIESVKQAAKSQIGIEHLIMDGGSKDGSVELAEAAGLRVLKEPETGLTGRLNVGYRAARGELIALLGADDVLLPGAVEAVIEAYRRTGRRWLVGHVRWITAQGRILGDFRAPPPWMTVAQHVALDWNVISPLATYMDREFFRELGGFDERYSVAADFDLFARALCRQPIERVSRPLACWRRHGQNHSAVHKELARREVRAIRESLDLSNGPGRFFQRYAMKAWCHLSNPGWSASKMTERARLRLGVARVSHFGYEVRRAAER